MTQLSELHIHTSDECKITTNSRMLHVRKITSSMSSAVKGTLIIRVEEACGKTNDGKFVWEQSAVGESLLEAFVKVEIRGGAQNVKVTSSKAPLIGETITWRENLKLEVLEGANELRLMLCREKFQGTKKGTSVIAACGIFVKDIIDAAPIDKYFELFKPNAGGEGGLIRICLDWKSNAVVNKGTQPGAAPDKIKSTSETSTQPKTIKKKKGGVLRILLPLALVGVAAGVTASVLLGLQPPKKKKTPVPPLPPPKKW